MMNGAPANVYAALYLFLQSKISYDLQKFRKKFCLLNLTLKPKEWNSFINFFTKRYFTQ
jgi:hypothetical protein